MLVALLGLAVRLLYPILRRGRSIDRPRVICTALLALAAVLVWALSVWLYVSMVAGTSSFFYSNEGMAWTTHARYLFPALVPVAHLMVLGLGRLVPGSLQSAGVATLAALLVYLNGVGILSLLSRLYWWAP